MVRHIYALCALTELAILSLAGRVSKRAGDFDVLDWIDPLVGTRNGGNVFAGATLPYGFAKGLEHDHMLSFSY